MLITGKRAFDGSNYARLVAAILTEQPQPLLELQPSTPTGLERILDTCLEKDPSKRWQTAREIKHALEWSLVAPSAPSVSDVPVKRQSLWQGLAAVLAVTAIGITTWMLWSRGPSGQVTRLQVLPPEKATFGRYVSVSPDGRKLVINTSGPDPGLWIRDLDAEEWRKLPAQLSTIRPFWSPDSRFLGFAMGDRLMKIDIAGGGAQTLNQQRIALGSGSWSQKGIIAFDDLGGNPIWKISQAGGDVSPITSVDSLRGETSHTQPTFLPDGALIPSPTSNRKSV